MDDFLKNLIEEFSFEAKNILQKLEHFFLSFHETLLDEIYREIHTLKGNAGVIYSNLPDDFELKKNFSVFKDIIHKFENIIKMLQSEELKFNEKLQDLSLKVIDTLDDILEITSKNQLLENDYNDILTEIEQYVEYPEHSETVESSELKQPEISSSSNSLEYEEISGSEFFEENTDDTLPDKTENIKLSSAKPKLKRDSSTVILDKFIRKEDFKIIQVKTDKIDLMLSYVSELINLRNTFDFIFNEKKSEIDIKLRNALQRLKSLTGEIQKSVLKLRLVPVKEIFQKFPRIVSEYQKIFNKKINLSIKGENIEVDKTILTYLNDILVHIVRNAIDHGIEHPEERIIAGKKEEGNILIHAAIEKDFFKLTIADDGRGINPEVIKEKILQKGLIPPEEIENYSEHQLIQLIFLPGFSTKDDISEVSGRGVGLDAVKDIIKKLNGRIEVFSKVGKGTAFKIYLPVSLNIIKVLLVKLYDFYFSIPYSDIISTFTILKKDIIELTDRYIYSKDGINMQIFDLGVLLNYRKEFLKSEEYDVVIFNVGEEKVGFVVDELIGEQEIVVNPLPDFITSIPGISGATILGNGKISVVLNLKDLLT